MSTPTSTRRQPGRSGNPVCSTDGCRLHVEAPGDERCRRCRGQRAVPADPVKGCEVCGAPAFVGIWKRVSKFCIEHRDPKMRKALKRKQRRAA